MQTNIGEEHVTRLRTLASNVATNAHKVQGYKDVEGTELFDDEGADEALEELYNSISTLRLATLAALEKLDLQIIAQEFQSELKSLDHFDFKIKDHQYFEELKYPYLEIIRKFISVMELSSPVGESAEEIVLFNQVRGLVESTPLYLKRWKITPSDEHGIRDAMKERLFDLLYEDARKEVVIIQGLKDFRGDLGIASIHTMIEFKFAKDEQGVKTAVGGLYEDFHGYAGDERWRHFLGVIYQCGLYSSQKAVNSMLREYHQVPKNWEVLLVTGE